MRQKKFLRRKFGEEHSKEEKEILSANKTREPGPSKQYIGTNKYN
jgi:hypothetical protein